MADPSLILGNGNWAVKSDSLLGYALPQGKYTPREFTVTRATTATRVNETGLVQLVPYNLVQYSEQFDNAAWTKTGYGGGLAPIVTPNAGIAPDGKMTADRVQFDCVGTTSTFRSLLGQGGLSTPIGSLFTQTLYVKAYSPSEVGKQLRVVSEGTNNSAIITVTADWQRIVVNGVPAIFATSNFNIETRGSFTTNTTADLLLWGAQLVEGTDPLDYFPTTTRLNIPRVDYSLGSANLLLEPQRTNLATFSTEFNDANWVKNAGVSVNVNTSNAPSGTLTADTIIGATGTTGWGGINTLNRQITSLSSLTAYTFSVYLKGSGNIILRLRDQSTGLETSLLCNLTTSWQRFEITRTTGAITTALGIVFGNASGNFDAWGAQLEAGAYATSYIPTTSASVTRNADSISRSNIFTNGYITSAGGTWFIELRNNVPRTRDASNVGFGVGSSSALDVNALYIRQEFPTSRNSIMKRVSGSNTTLFTTSTDTAKIAIKWNGSTADVFVNGVKQVSATAFTATTLEWLVAFSTDVPKYIPQMALYTTPLSDAECINMTL